jgi:hypothetical protein
MARNPEKKRAAHRSWCVANPDKVKANSKRDYEKHRERRRATNTAWNARNPERVKEHSHRYYVNNTAKVKERSQKRRVEKAAEVLDARLHKAYGISLEEYTQVLIHQGGVCAVCGGLQQSGKSRLEVDHDHETGAIRGLLCGKCNSLLAFAGDLESTLQSAIDYLRRTKK